MRILPKWKAPKLSKTRSNKKVMTSILKGGGKWLGTGLLFGAGAEVASHVASKANGDNEGQYISITDFGPSLLREDSVEASTNGQKRGLFGSRHSYILGIPSFILAILIVLMCRFMWRRVRCLGALTSCCWKDPQPKETPDSSTARHSEEAVDMETVFARLERDRLERDITSPTPAPAPATPEDDNHYAVPKKQLDETLSNIKESCALRAKRAHELDSSLHSTT